MFNMCILGSAGDYMSVNRYARLIMIEKGMEIKFSHSFPSGGPSSFFLDICCAFAAIGMRDSPGAPVGRPEAIQVGSRWHDAKEP